MWTDYEVAGQYHRIATTGRISQGRFWSTIPILILYAKYAVEILTNQAQIVSGRPANSSEYPTPRIITLGGDHTTTLSALRSTHDRWGQVSVIHFDSHLGRLRATHIISMLMNLMQDTWDPDVLGEFARDSRMESSNIPNRWRHLPLCVSPKSTLHVYPG